MTLILLCVAARDRVRVKRSFAPLMNTNQQVTSAETTNSKCACVSFGMIVRIFALSYTDNKTLIPAVRMVAWFICDCSYLKFPPSSRWAFGLSLV